MTAQAQVVLDRGDIREAQRLAEQADALQVPDQAYGSNETRPWQVLAMVNKAVMQRQGMSSAGAPASNGNGTNPISKCGVYVPENDATRTVKVQSQNSISGRRTASSQYVEWHASRGATRRFRPTAVRSWSSGFGTTGSADSRCPFPGSVAHEGRTGSRGTTSIG